ncbi:MAG TPA: hypothetical protein VF008_01905 [Niastella sp.]
MKTEDYLEELRFLEGIQVRVVTYKIGEEFHCHICNADPGATISRVSGPNCDQVLQQALEKATKRLERSVKQQ